MSKHRFMRQLNPESTSYFFEHYYNQPIKTKL